VARCSGLPAAVNLQHHSVGFGGQKRAPFAVLDPVWLSLQPQA
jgi:hypothetical protein